MVVLLREAQAPQLTAAGPGLPRQMEVRLRLTVAVEAVAVRVHQVMAVTAAAVLPYWL